MGGSISAVWWEEMQRTIYTQDHNLNVYFVFDEKGNWDIKTHRARQ